MGQRFEVSVRTRTVFVAEGQGDETTNRIYLGAEYVMGLASSLFGAFLIGVALVLQRWSAISWEDSSLKSADSPHSASPTTISSRGQLTRRTWTNVLIGLIGFIMIVSTRLPRGPWWLGAWTLIGLLLAMIVIMAMIDLVTTWIHYRRALSQITENSLGQSESQQTQE